MTDPLTAYPNSSFWDHFVRGPEGVEVLDDYTVRIHMRPHSDFMDVFRPVGILPEHLLGDVPHDQLAQHPYGTQCPVGNGPFVFREHRAQDRWVFEANPAFSPSLGGRPFVDRYVYRVIPEQSTLLTELLTEQVDVYIQPQPPQARRIEEAGSPVELQRFPSRQYVFVAWNARRDVLSDARVRRALAMGVNKEEAIGALLGGYGLPAHTGVPPVHWAFDAEASSVDYDPAGARALLEEAGWVDRDGDGIRENADGEPLSFSIKYNTGNMLRQRVAEIMNADLVEIGVDARPQVVEWETLYEQITTPDVRDFDGVVMGFTVEYRIDDSSLFHSERLDEPFAWSGTANPEIDRLLEELSAATDREDARGLWREYQRAMTEEQPYNYMYFPDRLVGVNERVRGEIMDARGEWQNIRQWHLDPEGR